MFQINRYGVIAYTAVIRRYAELAVGRRQLYTAAPRRVVSDIVHLFYILTAIGGCW